MYKNFFLSHTWIRFDWQACLCSNSFWATSYELGGPQIFSFPCTRKSNDQIPGTFGSGYLVEVHSFYIHVKMSFINICVFWVQWISLQYSCRQYIIFIICLRFFFCYMKWRHYLARISCLIDYAIWICRL